MLDVDFYLSFSLADDEATGGWISRFTRDFRSALIPRGIRPGLQVTNSSDDGLPFQFTRFERPTVLTIFLSNRYLQSRACPHEIQEFKRARYQSAFRSFIRIVEIQPTLKAGWPDAFFRNSYVEFWSDKETPLSPDGEPYRSNMRAIADRTCEKLGVPGKSVTSPKAETLSPNPDLPRPEKNEPASAATRLFLEADDQSWLSEKRRRGEYDVFLCHNSKDKLAVKEVAIQLIKKRIVPWLDEWDFQPGRRWQATLEARIDDIKSAAVFVGASGFGPWQSTELDGFLRAFVERECPVIPVIMSTCEIAPKLPAFLRGLTWVDFRQTTPDPLAQLVWGISGEQPGYS